MTVRFKIAFTIFITGLLTAIGVIAAVLLAFERFDRETTYYRASAFLERVVARHTDMFALRERFADDFNGFLANLVLFEPDTQLYLLDAQGTVIATSADIDLPKGFKVALAPVMDAAGPMPMPYVMGDDPAHGDANAIIAARPLRQTVIRSDTPVTGYLYLVSRQRSLPQGGWASLRSAFAQPAMILILVVVGLSTLLAAWVTSVVTRPLAQLTQAVADVTREGLEDHASSDHHNALTHVDPHSDLFAGATSTTRDEFGQLNNGISMMLATLRTQWRTLRRLDHFRREGVSNMSHDLRSPLTATAACLETLQGRWNGDEARAADRQLVEVALRNTHNAARLVHSLGDLAQLDEPEFKLQTQVMDVLELLDDVALRFMERAARGGVRIESGASKGITETGVAAAVDVELFERAIANLVDNALKFCPPGARISLDAQQTAKEVVVTVSDTGSGIAATDLPHLFDRFYQSRQSVAPATGEGGRGLGLAIVKRIVELHGGQVQVKSEMGAIGAGTSIFITLPLATA